MAKTLDEAKLSGRSDRKKLAVRPEPYWRGIDPDVHLGYRKKKRGGTWLVRWRVGVGYRRKEIGTADDELRDGTFDFEAATRIARAMVEAERRNERAKAEGPALTVASAIEVYMADRDARDSAKAGKDVRSDARSRLELYVVGRPARGKRGEIAAAPLATVALHVLEESELIGWRAALPDTLKLTTVRRLVNDLKAALNDACGVHRRRLPPGLPSIIKFGLSDAANSHHAIHEIARENQILSDDEVRQIIVAAGEIDAEEGWEGDLSRLVILMAATGARYSQIVRVRVADVQNTRRRVMVPDSRKGASTKKGSKPVPVGQDVLDALIPAIEGRADQDALLERRRSKRIEGGLSWERGDRGPWKTASELQRPWRAIRERAGLCHVIPYALRHTSIVRGIRQNLPIRLVAALHDTSVAMIERYYGRFITDGLDELAARAVVPLVQTAR